MGISSSHPQNIHRLNIELILIVNFLGFNQITPLKTCFFRSDPTWWWCGGAFKKSMGKNLKQLVHPPNQTNQTNMRIKHPPFEDVCPIGIGGFPASHLSELNGVTLGSVLEVSWYVARGILGAHLDATSREDSRLEDGKHEKKAEKSFPKKSVWSGCIPLFSICFIYPWVFMCFIHLFGAGRTSLQIFIQTQPYIAWSSRGEASQTWPDNFYVWTMIIASDEQPLFQELGVILCWYRWTMRHAKSL